MLAHVQEFSLTLFSPVRYSKAAVPASPWPLLDATGCGSDIFKFLIYRLQNSSIAFVAKIAIAVSFSISFQMCESRLNSVHLTGLLRVYVDHPAAAGGLFLLIQMQANVGEGFVQALAVISVYDQLGAVAVGATGN
jgi:hypothetical protein